MWIRGCLVNTNDTTSLPDSLIPAALGERARHANSRKLGLHPYRHPLRHQIRQCSEADRIELTLFRTKIVPMKGPHGGRAIAYQIIAS